MSSSTSSSTSTTASTTPGGGAGHEVTIVGAGLVGSLTALALGQRGFKVTVLEGNSDIRTLPAYTGRSINLALSAHGLEGLDLVGLGDEWRERGIPMTGRFIHNADGSTAVQPYGTHGEAILSVDRRLLNIRLMEEAEALPNVSFVFNADVKSIDYKSKALVYESPESAGEQEAADAASAAAGHSAEARSSGVSLGKRTLVETKTDLIVGADGAYSAVRTSLLKSRRFNYRQFFIDHGYKELNMAPLADGEWALEKNYLHIWPRGSFMLIALPNTDGSFTVTLFMPYGADVGGFDAIHSDDEIVAFMEENFADAIPFLGDYVADWKANRTGPLVTVKCSRYHYFSNVVLMGDAAHAITPFAGEGMNSSFQDTVKFVELLDHFDFGSDRRRLLAAYSEAQVPSGQAVADLALANYYEMRAATASSLFLFRKRIEAILHRILGDSWIPLYSMVHFTTMPYNEALERGKRQDEIITNVTRSIGIASLGALTYGVYVFFGASIAAFVSSTRSRISARL